MQLNAEALKDSKKHNFKAKSVTEECKSLELLATEASDVLTLARLFRYLAGHSDKSFAAAVHALLDGVGFEKPPASTGSADQHAPTPPPAAPQHRRRKPSSRSVPL